MSQISLFNCDTYSIGKKNKIQRPRIHSGEDGKVLHTVIQNQPVLISDFRPYSPNQPIKKPNGLSKKPPKSPTKIGSNVGFDSFKNQTTDHQSDIQYSYKISQEDRNQINQFYDEFDKNINDEEAAEDCMERAVQRSKSKSTKKQKVV